MKSKALALSAATALLISGCDSIPVIDLSSSEGRTALAPLAPEAREIMQCVGERVARYMKDAPSDQPLLIEVAPFRVRVQSATNRLDMPSEYTSLVEQLLTEGGMKLGFLEGMRPDRVGEAGRDSTYADDKGLRRAVAKIRIAGDVLFADSAVTTAGRGFNGSMFFANSDGSGSRNDQASVSAIGLTMSAVDPLTRIGGFGFGSEVRMTFDRTHMKDRSIAVSLSTAALGYNNVKKTTYGPHSSLRLGVALQLATVISRTQGIPVAECVEDVAPAVDPVPLVRKLEEFQKRLDAQPEAAARWLNNLRALWGQRAQDPAKLDSNAAASRDERGVYVVHESNKIRPSNDGALAVLAQRKLLRNVYEDEFILLWANLWRVPAPVFNAGRAWVQSTNAKYLADIEERLCKQKKGTRPAACPIPTAGSDGKRAPPA
jgi:hypothetical protein